MTVTDERGFTLAEMLVSLIIFSLSMAIIWQGAGLVSQLNNRINAHRTEMAKINAITVDVNARLSSLQPITDGQLTGHATHMAFQCEPNAPSQNCAYSAPFGHFVYISDGARYADWPPAKVTDSDEPARLTALALENDRGKSLAVIKFPVEHAANCQFDMISRTCRSDNAISETAP